MNIMAMKTNNSKLTQNQKSREKGVSESTTKKDFGRTKKGQSKRTSKKTPNGPF